MMSDFQDEDIELIRNQGDIKAIFQSASGHSGGLLSCWNSELYELCNFEIMQHCLGITLKVILTGQSICIFNIYGPQQSTRKKDFWKS